MKINFKNSNNDINDSIDKQIFSSEIEHILEKEKNRVLTVKEYICYIILFLLFGPLGILISLYFIFKKPKNKNVENFAKASFIIYLTIYLISLALAIILIANSQ